MMRTAPVIGMSCVVDRPGYNERYKEKYRDDRWLLCKTAFVVAVERAAKYAISIDYKLKVFVERGDISADRNAKQYFEDMRSKGMPFASATSGKYKPLSATDLKGVLYDFDTKYKSSVMAQFADLYLWPMCIGGYDPENRPYSRLQTDGKLIDSLMSKEDVAGLGIKYSCWELVDAERQKHQSPVNTGL